MKRPVSKSVWKRCQAHICPGTVRARNSFGCEMRVECQWTAGLASGLAWEMWSHLHFTFLEEEGRGFWPGFCWWHQRPFSTTSWTMVKPTEKWNIFLFPTKLKQFQPQLLELFTTNDLLFHLVRAGPNLLLALFGGSLLPVAFLRVLPAWSLEKIWSTPYNVRR